MKRFLGIAILCMLGTSVMAQWGEDELSDKPDWKERIFTGGGFGASFGSYSDYVSVSPLIGYRITQKLAGGIQVQYRYTNYKGYSPKISTNDFGVGPFLRYSLFGPIFLHAEYEYLNYQYVGYGLEKFRKGYNSVMAGGGFFQPMGRRAGLYALALYNFSYDDSDVLSPYSSPLVLRVGITAGF